MTQHPITPPPELVKQWRKSAPADAAVNNAYERHIATRAAQWAADIELEACCEWVKSKQTYWAHDELRATRRPKPPSLKEQALAALDDAIMRGDCITISDALPTIRRALEALPE